jgi:FkbM family methyltransferase
MAIVKDHAGVLPGAVDYRDFIEKDNPVIVQIGAHDGILGEEYGLQEFLEDTGKFRLILVEPLAKYFDNLVNVYGKYNDLVDYCNYAITDVDGEIGMVEQGCMSFISPHGPVKIRSKTWDSFIEEMKINKIDLLILDCEGYEFQILKKINFAKIKPQVIRYEYAHIANKEECDSYLTQQGYRIEFCKHDHTYNKVAVL